MKMKHYIVTASPKTGATVNQCIVIDSWASNSVEAARWCFTDALDSYRTNHPDHTYQLCETKATAI